MIVLARLLIPRGSDALQPLPGIALLQSADRHHVAAEGAKS